MTNFSAVLGLRVTGRLPRASTSPGGLAALGHRRLQVPVGEQSRAHQSLASFFVTEPESSSSPSVFTPGITTSASTRGAPAPNARPARLEPRDELCVLPRHERGRTPGLHAELLDDPLTNLSEPRLRPLAERDSSDPPSRARSASHSPETRSARIAPNKTRGRARAPRKITSSVSRSGVPAVCTPVHARGAAHEGLPHY